MASREVTTAAMRAAVATDQRCPRCSQPSSSSTTEEVDGGFFLFPRSALTKVDFSDDENVVQHTTTTAATSVLVTQPVWRTGSCRRYHSREFCDGDENDF